MNQKRKKLGRKLLSFLLTLAMFVGLMPGMSLTAYAATYDGNPYASLVNTTTTVKFNDIDWYIIKDESTAVDVGTVTLFAKEMIGGSMFHSESNAYSTSTVKSYLDGLTTEGKAFAGVADAIETVKVKGSDSDNEVDAKLWLLSTEEANSLQPVIRLCSQQEEYGYWWLRSPGIDDQHGVSVCAEDAYIDNMTSKDGTQGVRPALKLDLSKVTFDSTTKTFSVNSSTVNVESVTLAPSTTQTIDVGGKVSFTATVQPDNASDKKVVWSVGGTNAGAVKLYSDADCTTEVGANATAALTVYAKGISAGSATVTATSNEDSTKYAGCDVTVNEAPSVYSLSLNNGTEDAENWKAKANADDEFKMLPLQELNKDDNVTIQYTGSKKVKSIQAVTEDDAADTGTATTGKVVLYEGEQSVNWITPLTIESDKFANLRLGDKIVVEYKNADSSTLEYYSNIEILPGTRSDFWINGDGFDEEFVTSAMLSSLKDYGMEIRGAGFTVSKVYYCPGKDSIDEYTIWSGNFWMDEWNTIELATTCFKGVDWSTIKAIRFMTEAGHTDYVMNILTSFGEDGKIADQNSMTKTNDYFELSLEDNDIAEKLSSAGTLMIQCNKEAGEPFNFTQIQLVPDENAIKGVELTPVEGEDNTWTLEMPARDVELQVEYHVHDFDYAAEGATITATCNEDGCMLDDGTEEHKPTINLSIVKPTLTVYGETGKSEAATLNGTNDFNSYTEKTVTETDIKYYKATLKEGVYTKNGDALSKAPVDAGDYIAEITLTGVKTKDGEDKNVTAFVGYSIAKATPQVTAPTGKTLTYTGSAQALVTAGTATGGEMWYAVTTENTAPTDENLYTTSIPAKTNAGTYYVWYKVVGDENHLDSEPACVKTAIQKAKQTVTAKDISLKVGKSAKINAKTSGDGALSYKIKSGNAVTVDSKGNVKAVKAGASVITITAAGTDNYLSGTAQIKVTVTGEEGLNVQMLRLYNPNSGEHFYTASVKEKEDLVKAGWKYEGLAWKAPAKSKTPVYRLYNPNAGDHHFTMSAAEKASLIKAGWKDEGIGWYSDDAKTKPVYRAYSPNAVTGSHHYTLSKDEMKTLVKAGWKDEGIAFYAK